MKKALPALAVATAGAAIAFLMVTVHVATGLVVLVPIVAGLLALWQAKRATLGDPVGSLRWYGAAQLAPYGGAIGASSALIGLAIWLAPPEKPAAAPGVTPPPPTTFDKYWPEILKVLAGALSAFITAAFIKSTEDPDQWVADAVKSGFQKRFEKTFVPSSEADLALRSPLYKGSGWDADGRTKRAASIAAGLKDPTQRL